MKAKTCSMFIVIAMLSTAPLELSARTLGMVADFVTTSVTVFDADTHAILGTLTAFPLGFGLGDVLITPDLKQGFVAGLDHKVFVIDLTTSPPTLAGGINPIPISNVGADLSISPDGKFLVASGGGVVGPASISVVDIATRTEVSTFFTGTVTSSVEVCTDRSVLVTAESEVHRLILSGAGTLTDTGEVLSSPVPTNVYCAPSATSGVVLNFSSPGMTSFSIPGLAPIDNRNLSGNSGGMSGAINPSGNRIFARSLDPGSVDIFDFNSATGALGPSPLLTIPVVDATSIFGLEKIALHPNDGKLFVPEFGALSVYNPSTGALIASITDPTIVQPVSVTVATEADPCAGTPPAGAIVGTNDPNILNGTSGNDKIFGLGGSDTINGKGGNDLICGGDGNDLINGGPGNDTIKGGTGFDQITGGAGDDMLDVKDGVSGNDSANGGTHVGGDTCTADPGDLVSNCNP